MVPRNNYTERTHVLVLGRAGYRMKIWSRYDTDVPGIPIHQTENLIRNRCDFDS